MYDELIPRLQAYTHRLIDNCGSVWSRPAQPSTTSDSLVHATSRLRLTAMASHAPAQLRRAARVLGEVAREQGLDPARMGAPERGRSLVRAA